MKEDFTIAYEIAEKAVERLIAQGLIQGEAHLVRGAQIQEIQNAILDGLTDAGYVRIMGVSRKRQASDGDDQSSEGGMGVGRQRASDNERRDDRNATDLLPPEGRAASDSCRLD